MTKNEMCRIWLNISHFYWFSDQAKLDAQKANVRKSLWNSAALRSYTEALIQHDRMFDDLNGKVN